MTVISELLRDAARRLGEAGVDTGRLDARLLLGAALGREVWPHESAAVAPDSLGRFEALLSRRLAREPVSRILGRRAFWTLDLEVTADTLDPRGDSEALIEAAVTAFAGAEPPRRILDLGTGTGCLLLAALSEFPTASGLGIDRSAGAVDTALRNARLNGLEDRAEFRTLDWDDMPQGEWDLILSNPPYIPTSVVPGLQPEVARFDPREALVAGSDGLDAYRALMRNIPRLLAPRTTVIIELGAGQREAVEALARAAGLTGWEARKDLGGIDRALVLKWNDTGYHPLDT